MFAYSSNYLLFFFNYELIIPTCFFFFLFFVLISDQGQIGNSLKELSTESKLKLLKHLELRVNMIQELSSNLDRSISQIKRISISYELASNDILNSLQYIVKKSLINYTLVQIKYHLGIIIHRTNTLSLDIKRHLTGVLFLEKAYDLTKISQSSAKNAQNHLRTQRITDIA